MSKSTLLSISRRCVVTQTCTVGEGECKSFNTVQPKGIPATRKETLKNDMSAFLAEDESFKSHNSTVSHF